jgi:hypothetical protein
MNILPEGNAVCTSHSVKLSSSEAHCTQSIISLVNFRIDTNYTSSPLQFAIAYQESICSYQVMAAVLNNKGISLISNRLGLAVTNQKAFVMIDLRHLVVR